MDKARLEAMLEEATAHCYDEEEVFWAVFSALMGRVSLPLQARVGGEAVTFIGLDGPASDPEAGIMAIVRRGDQEESVTLGQVEVVEPDRMSAEWLAVYRYWREKAGGGVG
jgi:hypothetical protein